MVNQGSEVLTQVKVSCTLEESQEFVSGSGASVVTASARSITLAPLPELAPKATAVWRVVVSTAGRRRALQHGAERGLVSAPHPGNGIDAAVLTLGHRRAGLQPSLEAAGRAAEILDEHCQRRLFQRIRRQPAAMQSGGGPSERFFSSARPRRRCAVRVVTSATPNPASTAAMRLSRRRIRPRP